MIGYVLSALLLLIGALPALAQSAGNVGGYDSGPIYAEATPANSSHAAGASVGGLFRLNLARQINTAGASAIVTNLFYKSTGGSTGQLVVRLWSANPSHTVCTDNTAYSTTSELDDRFLLTAPFAMTPAAPAVTTGDSATYASLPNLTLDFKNGDVPPTTVVYLCALTVGTDTADQAHLVRWYISGPQN